MVGEFPELQGLMGMYYAREAGQPEAIAMAARDHWRPKGHVILCLNGSIDIEIADGAQLRLTPGQSYYVGDGEPGHRSSAVEGAKLFIVD